MFNFYAYGLIFTIEVSSHTNYKIWHNHTAEEHVTLIEIPSSFNTKKN